MFNFKASILNLLFKFEVVSDIPGRLRIKVNNFKKLPKEAVNFQSQAVEAVKRLDGVESVKFNFVIGTVLIEYDTDKIDSKAIVSWLNTIKKLALDNMDLINSLEGKDEKEVIDILFNILDANTSK
ncbi:HMA2 domain-containing protein [Peptostreptococcus stomatis]|uniref:HMA2 domain-containing protein n=1 Tax=Peptostreptococcus stomatis TaxID=341694 RepID=UPI0026EF5B84|nr:cation transporter [Peptostreptococcus stomatis]